MTEESGRVPPVAHGDAVIRVPKTLRRTLWTSPVPPHVRQAIGAVPGSAPLPRHRSQTVSRSSSTSRRTPNAASWNDSPIRTPTSSPRRVRVRGPRRRDPIPPKPPCPKNISKMSEMSANGWPPGPPAPAAVRRTVPARRPVRGRRTPPRTSRPRCRPGPCLGGSRRRCRSCGRGAGGRSPSAWPPRRPPGTRGDTS